MIIHAALLVLLAAPVMAAAPVPAPGTIAGESVDLKTADGWTLKAAWSRAREGKRTFILLHGKGGSKESWRRLAVPLSRAGYGYLAVDLRGHGGSGVSPSGQPRTWRDFQVTKAANDYADMVNDVDAAVAWLGTNGVPAGSVGFVGAEVGGTLAIKYAAGNAAIAPIVILSPGLAYQDIPSINAVRAYRSRPMLMIYSLADKTASSSASAMHAFAKRAAGEDKAAILAVPEGVGTGLLRSQRDLSGLIVEWVGNPAGGTLTAAPAAAPAGPDEFGDGE